MMLSLKRQTKYLGRFFLLYRPLLKRINETILVWWAKFVYVIENNHMIEREGGEKEKKKKKNVS